MVISVWIEPGSPNHCVKSMAPRLVFSWNSLIQCTYSGGMPPPAYPLVQGLLLAIADEQRWAEGTTLFSEELLVTQGINRLHARRAMRRVIAGQQSDRDGD